MVVSKTEVWTRWRKVLNISGAHRKKGFKVYLLHEECIHDVYQKKLTEYAQLNHTSNITEEWRNIWNFLEKVDDEVLINKQINTWKRGLKI